MNPNRFKRIVVLTTLFLLSLTFNPIMNSITSAQGNTYYVATDGVDDLPGGTSGDPWATITYALDHVPDDSLILVRAGDYNGRVRLRGTFSQGVTVRSEVPYQARLRHDATVVTSYYGQGITLEGFDIAHSGSGAGALVIQSRPLPPGGWPTPAGRVPARPLPSPIMPPVPTPWADCKTTPGTP